MDQERELIRDLRREFTISVDMDRGPLRQIEKDAVAPALATAIGGYPDVLFALDNEKTPGVVLYTAHWIRDAVFGTLTVLRPHPQFSGPPTIESSVRPIAQVRRVDLRIDVKQGQFDRSEFDIRSEAKIHWREDDSPTQIDGTFSGNYQARDRANELIKIMLGRIGASLETQGNPAQ